jgi:hypothetical protein
VLDAPSLPDLNRSAQPCRKVVKHHHTFGILPWLNHEDWIRGASLEQNGRKMNTHIVHPEIAAEGTCDTLRGKIDSSALILVRIMRQVTD